MMRISSEKILENKPLRIRKTTVHGNERIESLDLVNRNPTCWEWLKQILLQTPCYAEDIDFKRIVIVVIFIKIALGNASVAE